MTVRLEDHAIVLEGVCSVEQVEALLTLLGAHPELPVDIAAAAVLHTALWQAMLMMRPRMVGTPGNKFAADHILPALRRNFVTQDPDGLGGELAIHAT